MDTQPLVTILISVFNDESNLDRCFQNVHQQTFKNYQVQCINDRSTDNSLSLIKKWRRIIGPDRFNIINNDTNLGLTISLNKGLKKINTKYTARLDGDDWWHPRKLERQVSWLENHPDYGLIGCHFYGVTTNTNRIKKHYFDTEDAAIKKNIFRRNPFAHSAVVFKTDLAQQAGGYNEECRYGQDYDLWLRLAVQTRLHNMDEFLCWRNTDTGISIRKQRPQMAQSIKTRFHFINEYGYSKYNYIHLIEPIILIITPDVIKKIKRNFLPSNLSNYQHLRVDQSTKVFYLNDSILPNKFANAVARIAMAGAFASHPQVTKTTFFYQTTPNNAQSNLLASHKVIELKHNVSFSRTYATPLTKSFNAVIYSLSLLRTFFVNIPREYDLIYLRTGSLAGLTIALRNILNKRKIFFELHNYEFGSNLLTDTIYKSIFSRFNKLITISDRAKENWVNNGIDSSKILVLPSGADLVSFDEVTARHQELRQLLSLPIKQTILLYCGHLYRDRGIEDIIYVADQLKSSPDLQFIFLGGANEDITYYQQYITDLYSKLTNITFLGHVQSNQIPKYLKAADVIFATYSTKCPTLNHMSPMKLFESMASQVPMITADTPRIRNIIDDSMATFYTPDDPVDLQLKTQQVLNNRPIAEIKAKRAHQEVAQYTWQRRVDHILSATRAAP